MLRNFLKTVIDYAVCVYLILILAVMPFYNRDGYSHIGTDKSVFFNSTSVYIGRVLAPITVIYLVVLILKLKKKVWKTLKDNLSVTDLFAAGYGLTLIISYLCSDYRSSALWGATGWYMGFWPQMFLVLTYFFVSKLWKPRKWVLYLGLAASVTVFALGYLNRFGVDPLRMDIGIDSFISTIGNINWYCGYLVSIFFAGAALLWQQDVKRPWLKLLLMLYVTVGFGSLVSQGSESGIVTLGIVIVVMFCLSVRDSERMLVFWQEMTLLGCACLITYILRTVGPRDNFSYDTGIAELLTTGPIPFIMTLLSFCVLAGTYVSVKNRRYTGKVPDILAKVVVSILAVGIIGVAVLTAINTFYPGSIGPLSKYPLFTFSEDWGSSRGATWSAGWRCFAEQNVLHKLIGVGPDAMSAYLYRDGSAELLQQVQDKFGSATLTNAHNEWLTVLTNMGVLGLLAFGGMMSTAIYRYLRKVGKLRIVCACGICLLAYTVNNVFSFQQAMNVSTIFVILGMGEAFLQAEERSGTKSDQLHPVGCTLT